MTDANLYGFTVEQHVYFRTVKLNRDILDFNGCKDVQDTKQIALSDVATTDISLAKKLCDDENFFCMHSVDIDGMLNSLLTAARARCYFPWYSNAYKLLRLRLLLPKLMADLILCYCAIQDMPVSVSLLCGLVPLGTGLDFRTIYCSLRSTLDLPTYCDRCTCPHRVAQICPAVVRIHLSAKPTPTLENQSRINLSWDSYPYTTGAMRDTFCKLRLPARMQPFLLLAVEQSVDDPFEDPLVQSFASLVVQFYDENDDASSTMFQHADVEWTRCGSVMWYFIPLISCNIGDRFAIVRGEHLPFETHGTYVSTYQFRQAEKLAVILHGDMRVSRSCRLYFATQASKRR